MSVGGPGCLETRSGGISMCPDEVGACVMLLPQCHPANVVDCCMVLPQRAGMLSAVAASE